MPTKEKDEKEEQAPLRRNGKLTRAGMERVIRDGGSVLVNVPVDDGSGQTEPRIIGRIEDLPDEADLVAGDEQAIEAAHASLDQEEARLAARRASLERARTRSAAAPAPAGEKDKQPKK